MGRCGMDPRVDGEPHARGAGPHRRRRPGPDPCQSAWAAASAVVGLYGDPTVSWSIVVQADLAAPLDAGEVGGRLADLVDRYPHLGGPPRVEPVVAVETAREAFATTPYHGRAPLVRVGLAESPPALLVAAHHGAVDGLGLLALLGAATGRPVSTNAAGLADRRQGRSFAVAAARRAVEALFTPPTRFCPAPDPAAGAGEVLLAAELPPTPVGTAALTAAAAAVLSWWNASHAAADRRIVAAVGASRRAGAELRPEYRATYLRLPLRPGTDRAAVRDLLDRHPPEPDFPPSRNPVVGLARRILANRLGATFLASNLGVVEVGEPATPARRGEASRAVKRPGSGGTLPGKLADCQSVRGLSFFPQPSGPAGVAFGAASTAGATSVTIRVRRRDFSDEAAALLLARLVTILRQGGR
jgi:hypothetical protein